ncbi:unnamed protein product [Urochloa decumbens]|uniref:Late embryogenesis abundant protein LEA-2 subgroup domain-containing protein n=1 Tax=Urochloa decumbens TaxID=240449 RepID=A0ABC9E5A4_9POAL
MAPPAAGLTLKAAPSTKQYTVAALAAALAVATVVTVFFVVLCPAHLAFSVAHTGFDRPSGPTGGTLQLSLTLAIDNPSQRAAVVYKSMFVDVSKSTAAVWDSWVRATVAPPMPMRQPRRRAVAVAATVDLVGPLAGEFTGNMTSSSFAVIVTAQARFKVGVAWTRLYDIKVSCAPVSFFPVAKASRHTAAAGGGGAGDGLPVKCV